MSVCDLTQKKCVPCEGGIPPLKPDQVTEMMKQISGWALNGKLIEKEFLFNNFVEGVQFVNRVMPVAESEGHHPDILIHGYKKVKVMIFTHAVGGLTENDFILAAKIDSIPKR